ncbi:MAG: S16 family serine protease [Acidimicrobiia bacterium]
MNTRTGSTIRALALVLVLALVTASCGSGGSDDTGGDDPAQTDTGGEGSAQINALFFSDDGSGEFSGGANGVRVRVNDIDGDEFRVGFSEDEVAGTGDQWRASGWEAATVATIISGGPLTGREVTYDIQGKIDGPSAGGALTVATLSAFRGDELDPNVVMTGTINPDGTIGPVGGIPQKISGAVAVANGDVEPIGGNDSGSDGSGDEESLGVVDAALRPAGDDLDTGDSGSSSEVTMLIPAGQEMSVDLATGEEVNVIDVAEAEGVQVKEVADIYEAYEEFTGVELPRFRFTEDSDTSLDEEVSRRVQAATEGWLGRYDEALAGIGALGAQGQEFALSTGLVDEADSKAADSADLTDRGLHAAAYTSAAQAAVFATAARSAGESYELGLDEWQAVLEQQATVCTEVDALVDTLGGVTPETVTDASGLIAAYTNAIDGVSICGIAENLRTRPADSEDQAINDLLLAGLYYEVSSYYIVAAEDQLEFARDLGGEKLADVEVASVADFFRRAAEANLNAFDTVVLAEEAKSAGASVDVVREQFAENFFEYGLATAELNVLSSLEDYFGDPETAAYAELGGALTLYTLSSSLLSQFYSFGVVLDDNNNVVDVDNDLALLSALDLGEDQLGGAINTLRSEGIEPVAPTGAFETAENDRGGSVDDQISALETFWAGYVNGRILGYLGGSETAGLE